MSSLAPLTVLPLTVKAVDTGMETSPTLVCRSVHTVNRETQCWCVTLGFNRADASCDGQVSREKMCRKSIRAKIISNRHMAAI